MSSNKIKTSLRNLIIITLVIGVFFTGYFLGNIAFDLNPKGKERDYKLNVDTWGDVTVDIKGDIEEGKAIKFNITGLNRSTRYIVTRVAFYDFDKIIDGYYLEFTNRSFLDFSLDVQKTFFQLFANKTNHLEWCVDMWIYEEITLIDLIQAIPRLTNFDILSMALGIIVGGIINIGYFLLRSNIKEIAKNKIKNRE